MPKYKKHEFAGKVCPSRTTEELKVTVPVEVKGHYEIGQVKIHCKGCPAIEPYPLTPHVYKESKFAISQKLEVDIPIMFGAEVEIEEGYVDYEEPKEHCRHHEHHKHEYDEEPEEIEEP